METIRETKERDAEGQVTASQSSLIVYNGYLYNVIFAHIREEYK